MDDQIIIESIRTGKNDTALRALYKNFPRMRKMIRSNGGGSNDAEDIFQEALLILIRKIRNEDFRLTSLLSTYLFSVCRYLWKDQLKKRKPYTSFDTDSEPAGFDEREMREALEWEEHAQLAEKVLHGLRDRCRELLLLFYEGRLPLKEIAVKMGYSSENTAKNQKYKCLEGAKNKLKDLKHTIPTF